MKPYRLLALLLLLALLCEPALAQMEDVAPSDIVRVSLKPSTPGEWSQRRVAVVGRIVSVSDDSLKLRSGNADHSFSLRTIERMEVKAGTRRAVFEGAMIGAGVGAFFGLFLAGGLSSEGDNCWSCMTNRERRELEEESSWFSGEPSPASSSSSTSINTSTAILIGSAATGIGLVIGTVFGAATRVDRWQKVPVGEAPRFQALISAGSVGMRLTF